MSDDEFDLSDAEGYFTEVNAGPVVVPARQQQHNEVSIARLLHDEEEESQSTAAQTCLALPEILERIILQVPPLEVYQLQRVSTMFRDLISRSIPIRRYMYFVPERYFIRPELRSLLEPRTWQRQTKLSKALYPFRFCLYARREECGVDIDLFPGWMEQKLPDYPRDPFPEVLREEHDSWHRILIWDSTAPIYAVMKTPSSRFGPLQSSSRLTGQVTLGDLVAEAKKLTKKVMRTRHILGAMEGSACMTTYDD